MDWTQILLQLGVTIIGALVGALIPALLFAYWCGGMNMRLVSIEKRCSIECERQAREHSRLFLIADEHAHRVAEIEGSLHGIDRRLTLVEES